MAKRLTREESKEQTRAKLLEAGRKAFAEKGLDATQIRDVIGEAGLAIGTFYLHFKSKEELFAAVVEEGSEELRRRLREARRDEKAGVTQRAEKAVRAFCEFVVEGKDFFRVLFREGVSGPGERASIAQRMIEDSISDLRDDLESGFKVVGTDRKTLDRLAQAIIGMCAAVGFRLVEETTPDVEGAVRFLTRMIQGGTAGVLAGALGRK